MLFFEQVNNMKDAKKENGGKHERRFKKRNVVNFSIFGRFIELSWPEYNKHPVN